MHAGLIVSVIDTFLLMAGRLDSPPLPSKSPRSPSKSPRRVFQLVGRRRREMSVMSPDTSQRPACPTRTGGHVQYLSTVLPVRKSSIYEYEYSYKFVCTLYYPYFVCNHMR